MKKAALMRDALTRRARGGYTMIEVMMGLAILAVGATGVIALQKTAALGTVTSRHLANATNISRSVIEAAEADAMQWTDNDGSLGPTGWLNPGGGLGLASNLEAPPWHTLPVNSFSLNLEPLDPSATNPVAVAYCSHVRVTWLGDKDHPEPARESTAVRLEVRTIFARAPRDISAECNPANVGNVTNLLAGTRFDFGSGERGTDEYGAVYLTTVIRRGQ